MLWHRRSGKDLVMVSYVGRRMAEQVGSYFYFFPTYAQGRKILWEGIDKEGVKFLDHFPGPLIKSKNDSMMKLEYINGSIFRVVGTDNIDSIVGTNPVGCVFSEYSLQDPRAWDYIRPIVAENGGWAVFNYTPRGNNHGKQIWDIAKSDSKRWWSQRLTVEETKAIPDDVLIQERAEIIAKDGNDSLYKQEYMCSFEASLPGAYYASQMEKAEEEKRITTVPYDPAVLVNTHWDLGVGDSTTIWFSQIIGQEAHLIDYYDSNGEGLPHYAKVLQDKGYIYGRHVAPHDIEARELGTGKSRKEIAQSLGINFVTAPRLSVEDGIEAARNVLSRCWFDRVKCQRGIDALKSYHKEYDEKRKTYKSYPEHDWSSDGADAFRMFAIDYRRPQSTSSQDFSQWEKIW